MQLFGILNPRRFLFSGDDWTTRRVLSACERTRLRRADAAAPSQSSARRATNHLTSTRKKSSLALVDYRRTLVFVSHYGTSSTLATKTSRSPPTVSGDAIVYPGTYKEFLWHKGTGCSGRAGWAHRREEARGQPNRANQAAARHHRQFALGTGSHARHSRAWARGGPRQCKEAIKKPATATPTHIDEEKTTRRCRGESPAAADARRPRSTRSEKQSRCEPRFGDRQTMACLVYDNARRRNRPSNAIRLMWQIGDLMHRLKNCCPQGPRRSRQNRYLITERFIGRL